MKIFSFARFRLVLIASALGLVSLSFTGCETTDGGDGGGFYSREPVTPIEGASYMQDRLGQLTRSSIR